MRRVVLVMVFVMLFLNSVETYSKNQNVLKTKVDSINYGFGVEVYKTCEAKKTIIDLNIFKNTLKILNNNQAKESARTNPKDKYETLAITIIDIFSNRYKNILFDVKTMIIAIDDYSDESKTKKLKDSEFWEAASQRIYTEIQSLEKNKKISNLQSKIQPGDCLQYQTHNVSVIFAALQESFRAIVKHSTAKGIWIKITTSQSESYQSDSEHFFSWDKVSDYFKRDLFTLCDE